VRAYHVTRRPHFWGVLFGKRIFQDALLRIAREGSVGAIAFEFNMLASALASTGFVTRSTTNYAKRWSLEPRHPAHAELLATLRALDPNLVIADIPAPGEHRLVRGDAPLAHSRLAAIRILIALLEGPMTKSRLLESVQQRPPAVEAAIASLVEDGLLVDDPGSIRYADDVPPEYLDLVRKIEAALSGEAREQHVAKRKKMAFERADDNAPRFFESDARLRNFMALAVNGPMYAPDLAALMGARYVRPEDHNYAPFGRGGVVATWQTNFGPAVGLDPNHPVAAEFREFLIALERIYPVARLKPDTPLPPIPEFGPWFGDKEALFGFRIPTGILYTIGTLGWTFEALCLASMPGTHRENLKKVLWNLEQEGILASNRPRRPGFDVRIVTLDETFPVKAELETLLKRCVEVWPEYANLTRAALAGMPDKTHVHLRNRGILPGGKPKKKKSPTQFSPERQAAVLMEYDALVRKHGKPLNSNDLMKLGESGLYFRIRSAFGAFADFQEVLANNGI